ncbi:MAG: helix-turn-helix transcriptional regulator [Bacillota bacterium]|nr:helix-turn-helix transcriptional regulator [Bacillota bacterium]
MNQFYKRLRELRQINRMTLDELAVALNTTKTTLSRYENNKRTADSDFIVTAATFFAVSADYILGLSDNPLTVNDLLSKHRIMVDDLSESDISTVNSIVEELRSRNK